ncbi:hypothetical protein L596_000682 [Steinernema carpocapsae]|uniref:Piwi domain-containing protein n=1 Tax=Steinernema carpocapsae TaxID=34508 RepID=A0A4U8UN15_STECR|nr:hypothetical protein L596_000682 [Steinernema carpocapsae]
MSPAKHSTTSICALTMGLWKGREESCHMQKTILDRLGPVLNLYVQNAICGTSRPTRYIVFYDDWNLTADQIQAATFCLCFLNSNCTKAISLPAPAYYASKGVERGKKYLNTCMLRREDIQPNEPLMMPKSISNSM